MCVCFTYTRDARGCTRAYAHSTYHSPIDIDGEWWTTMRRLIESRVEYMYTRAIRCARISISIDIYPARGLRSTSREGTDPIVHLTNIVLLRPAFERPASPLNRLLLSFYLFACVSVIFSFRTSFDRPVEEEREKRDGDTENFGAS